MGTGAEETAAFDPLDPAVIQCPWPSYARLRAEEPVHRIEHLDIWWVTRHDLVLDVVRNPAVYSNNFGRASMPQPPDIAARLAEVALDGWPRVPTMLTADPPNHTRFRRLVSKAFSARAIAEMEPTIRAITSRLIDSWIDGGHVEVVSQFASPLPVEVIAAALMVPDDRLDDFKQWSDDSTAGIGTRRPVEELLAGERGVNAFQHHFAAELDRRRAKPRDDLLTRLLEARIDDDDPDIVDHRPLETAEMLSILQQILVAGHETTTKLLTEAMHLLGNHPGEWDRLRSDPLRVDSVVEEALRLATPSQGMWRITTSETTLGGVTIPAGARLFVSYAAANRDSGVFDDPDSFDPDRARLVEHLAFGKGTHFCLGAALARLEGRIALGELSRRIESYTLSASNDFEYLPSFMLRGLRRLEIDFVPAGVPAAAAAGPAG